MLTYHFSYSQVDSTTVKRRSFSTRWAVVAILLPLLALLPSTTTLHASSSDPYHPYGYFVHPYPDVPLRPGDIVIGHYPGQEYTIVGYWSHAGILYKYDSTLRDWLVVEALFEGVRINTLREFLSRYSAVVILRVKGVSDSAAAKAASWAYSKLYYPYDWNGYYKQVYGSSYYCSELVWAAYMATTGVDIDAYAWLPQNWFGVLPGEIVADSDTYTVWYSNLEN
uniref:Permuted papain-like amidase enzyme, YaeF/YiiX, C92 family n=1 Tax=Thermofilum pendens TaxID=2269 RepID=A0A7C4BAF3_THEPE